MTDVNKVNRADVVDTIALSCNQIGKLVAQRMAVNFRVTNDNQLTIKVSQTLNLTYQTVITKDEYDILQFLLMYGKEILNLAKQYINVNSLDLPKVSGSI